MPKTKPWLRPKFGLRALLILMLLASAFCGGWAANEWKHRAELERQRAQTEQRSYRVLVTSGGAQTVRVWDLETGQPATELQADVLEFKPSQGENGEE